MSFVVSKPLSWGTPDLRLEWLADTTVAAATLLLPLPPPPCDGTVMMKWSRVILVGHGPRSTVIEVTVQ